MVQTMKKNLKIIKRYLNSIGIHTLCTPEDDTLFFPILKNTEGKVINEFIKNSNGLIYTYVSIKFDFFMQEETKHKISEYLHRANYNMIRGNFEYNFDENFIRFKFYFEKNVILRKNYTVYNILVSAKMFQKYFKGLLDILSTDKSPKELIDMIESPKSNLKKDTN